MKIQPLLRNAAFLAACTILLTACDENTPPSPGMGKAPSPERVSPAIRCLRQHPAMKVSSFEDSVSAVKAFFQASVDCHPTEQEMDTFGAWLEGRGVRIKEGAR